MAVSDTETLPGIEALDERLDGRVILPGHVDYDGARRLYNAMFDARPVAIAECASVADVVAGVRYARALGLPLCVRGSGHGVDGKALADGAFALDLQRLDAVTVDADARRATVGPGARWRAVDAATQRHGLALTAGTVSDTGVAGLTLGGGIGYAIRKLGATVDNLVSIDAVTVDGAVVRASADENPDLFWAMRGGGGNFAIATAFEFQLHPLGPIVVGGMIVHDGTDARGVLRAWRDYMDDAPDDVMSIALTLRAPAAPLFPPELHGRPVVTMYVVHLGDPEQGEEALRPLREIQPPLADLVRPLPYVELQRLQEGSTVDTGMRWYEKASYLPSCSDALIDEVVARVEAGPRAAPGTRARGLVALWRLGGAFTRVPEDALAFVRQDAEYLCISSSSWHEAGEDADWMAWARDTHTALEPYASPHIYFNLADFEGDEARLRAAYGGPKFARLGEIKRRWDPDNVLRHTKNIRPS